MIWPPASTGGMRWKDVKSIREIAFVLHCRTASGTNQPSYRVGFEEKAKYMPSTDCEIREDEHHFSYRETKLSIAMMFLSSLTALYELSAIVLGLPSVFDSSQGNDSSPPYILRMICALGWISFSVWYFWRIRRSTDAITLGPAHIHLPFSMKGKTALEFTKISKTVIAKEEHDKVLWVSYCGARFGFDRRKFATEHDFDTFCATLRSRLNPPPAR